MGICRLRSRFQIQIKCRHTTKVTSTIWLMTQLNHHQTSLVCHVQIQTNNSHRDPHTASILSGDLSTVASCVIRLSQFNAVINWTELRTATRPLWRWRTSHEELRSGGIHSSFVERTTLDLATVIGQDIVDDQLTDDVQFRSGVALITQLALQDACLHVLHQDLVLVAVKQLT